MMIETKRGFITVATGEYYCWLAENFVMSYKLFSKTNYPMYVITDKKGEKRLKKYFDGVIVLENPHYTFMDKIMVYQNSPFEETVFLDADMDIISDISYIFDEFEKNGSDVSCIGWYKEISEKNRPNHFGKAAVERFGLKKYIAFGGGIYYFKRGVAAQKVMDTIFNVLIPDYDQLELVRLRKGQMIDESLMGLSLLINKMDPIYPYPEKDIMKYHNDMMKTLNWDMNKKQCTFLWWNNEKVSPSIVHYGTHNTYHRKYVYYNSMVRCKYHRVFLPFYPFYIIGSEFHLFFRHMFRPSDRKAFWNWVKAHFTLDHMRYRKEQIISVLVKKGFEGK